MIDLRSTAERDALNRLMRLWHDRTGHARSLSKALPGIRSAAATQLDEIASLPLRSRKQAA